MLPDGMRNASTRKARTKRKMRSAPRKDLRFSRAALERGGDFAVPRASATTLRDDAAAGVLSDAAGFFLATAIAGGCLQGATSERNTPCRAWGGKGSGGGCGGGGTYERGRAGWRAPARGPSVMRTACERQASDRWLFT